MSKVLSEDVRVAIQSVITALETAWNAADAVAFGAVMTADVDFVNIRAEHIRGCDAVVAGHAAIFRSIYANSTVKYTLKAARLLAPEMALAHVDAILDVPAGPFAGRHTALFSMVLQPAPAGWLVAAFHNTLAPTRK